jgi:cellulose synthase (UDP-forming)
MQMNGWNTAYINIPQAAGPGHRAALGARRPAHSLGARHDPDSAHRQSALRAGLKFPQRLCYFNAMAIFSMRCRASSFSPRRLIYLLLNHTNIPGYWAAILAYALPHLTLSNVTNSRIQGEHRIPSGTRSTRPCSRPTFCCPP